MSVEQPKPKPVARRLVLVGCRGVQSGSGSTQVNVSEFRLVGLKVKWRKLLARREVLEALRALAAAPEDPARREEAAAALRGDARLQPVASSMFVGGQLKQRRVHLEGRALRSASERLENGTVVVFRDCEGVQSGAGSVQHNRFSYICRDFTVDAETLVARHPQIAGAVVDHLFSGPANAAELGARLKAALTAPSTCADIDERVRTGTTSRDGVKWKDYDGLSLGTGATVRNDPSVVLDRLGYGCLPVKTDLPGGLRLPRTRPSTRRRAELRTRPRVEPDFLPPLVPTPDPPLDANEIDSPGTRLPEPGGGFSLF
ncbi:hypothetical protein [Streptomyces collinus]|uniref:hypothetical protein n=1 Tax=Streptomyces collinus TaxID=42684 RepID=UPI0036E0AC8D